MRANQGPLLSAELSEALSAAIALATVGTAPRPEINHAFTPDYERVYRILVHRNPPWLAAWAEEALRRQALCWPLVRLLVRQGLMPRPNDELYGMGLMAGAHREGPAGPLVEEPDVLDRDIWLIFEVEGSRDTSMSLCERAWTETLLRLSGQGRLSRPPA